MLAGILIKNVSPAFGKLTAQEQDLEGSYRKLHTELISHSEEIAFYEGHNWERKQLDTGMHKLFKHIRMVLKKKFWMGIIDSMLVKYGAVMIGYAVVGLPVFGPNSAQYLASRGGDQAQITKDYVRNSSLLINLAKAIGRLVVSYKEIQNLAGFTTLVWEMDEVLKDLSQGKYKRVMVTKDGESKAEFSSTRGGARIV